MDAMRGWPHTTVGRVMHHDGSTVSGCCFRKQFRTLMVYPVLASPCCRNGLVTATRRSVSLVNH